MKSTNHHSRRLGQLLAGTLISALGAVANLQAAPDSRPAQAGCFSENDTGLKTHRIQVDLFPLQHGLQITDTLSLPAGGSELHLNAALEISDLRGLNQRLDYQVLPGETEASSLQRIILEPEHPELPLTLLLTATGVLFESTTSTTFSHENVGREISATVSEEGIYLGAGAGWYPQLDDLPGCFRITISSPAGIECLTNGELVSRREVAGRLTTVWQTQHPSDGPSLIGGAYRIQSRSTSSGTAVYTWFLAEDPELVDLYLTQSVRYLELYEQLLSPYPYERFTVVENFFPTGYGMPGWTLLGGDVIRLPFIPYTSLGHEILHNWWGNSVFVDAGLGNWCEGITVYQADYLYKQQRGEEDARRYRKNTLKQFTSYVKGENDIPLVEFRQRHDPATRSIGYGKSMMLFHMVEEMIGTAAFNHALRDVIRDHAFRQADFAAFSRAFSRAAGRDLEPFFTTWLHQRGAANLRLVDAQWDGKRLRLELGQAEPTFPLAVPVRLQTTGGSLDTTLSLTTTAASYELAATDLRKVEIDPDYHLFRYLLPEEMEASFEQAFADSRPYFCAGGETAEVNAFAAAICDSLSEDQFITSLDRLPAGATCYLFNPDTVPASHQLHFELASDRITLAGQTCGLTESTVVLVERLSQRDQVLVFLFGCREPARMGRRLQHYGKYSWLLFQEGRNQGKGYWPVTASPLSREWP